MHFQLCVLLVCAASALAGDLSKYSPKQLSGPPEEFAQHYIPNPVASGVASRAATFWVTLTPDNSSDDGLATWTSRLPLDSNGFMFAVFSPELQALVVTLTDPQGQYVPLDDKKISTGYPVGDSSVYDMSMAFNFPNTTVLGVYELKITGPASLIQRRAADVNFDAYVLLQSDSEDLLFTHLASFNNLLQGQQVTLLAKMYDSNLYPRTYGMVPKPNLKDIVLSAELQARFPDGHWEYVEMKDDGLHGDGEAGDGEYGANVEASQAGSYQLQASFHGTNQAGEFVRVSEHLLTVQAMTAQLTGNAFAVVRALKQRLDMYLVLDESADASTSFRGYAEVWGTNATGQPTPAAWSSSMVEVQRVMGAIVVKLEVDLKWLKRAGVKAPYTLKNVYLQDALTYVPVSTMSSIPLPVVNSAELNLDEIEYDGVSITPEMREGIMPDHIVNASASASNPRLVLVHGYCSTGNPWLNTSSLWPADSVYFSDPGQTRPHDTFAKMILDFVAANGVEKCAFIGHSQGGIVTSHILNHYFTCADANTKPGRKHTSLGSPYLGCTGAGGYADVLKILGGCGSNFDLTPDGAALWSSGMAANTWSNVHYYTTRAKPGWINNNGYCNLLTNVVLNQPNDGVTEQVYAEPPLANNHGLTTGECHVGGMNWPASFLNVNRNKEILAAMAL